jgi:hypothetical protein
MRKVASHHPSPGQRHRRAADSDRHARASLKIGVGISILYTVDHEDQSASPLDAVAKASR